MTGNDYANDLISSKELEENREKKDFEKGSKAGWDKFLNFSNKSKIYIGDKHIETIPIPAEKNVTIIQEKSSFMFRLYIIVAIIATWGSFNLTVKASTIGVKDHEMYFSSTLPFLGEILKVTIAFVLYFRENNYSPSKFLTALNVNLLQKPLDFVKISVPAVIFCFVSNLDIIAAQNLSVGAYQCLSQFKIVTTALFTALFLKKTFKFISIKKWCCLLLIFTGIVVVPFGDVINKKTIIGLGAIVTICISAGFATVYFERMLKNGSQPSLWLRSIQLYSWSTLGGFIIMVSKNGNDIYEKGTMFYGFNYNCIFLIVLIALGGIYTSLVVMYLDTSSAKEGFNYGPVNSNIQQNEVQYVPSDIDTDSIIRPIISPVARMFEMAEQSRKMVEYGDKYEEKKKQSIFDPDSFLEALGLKTTTTTKAPTLMEKLFNPIFGPIKKDLDKLGAKSPFEALFPDAAQKPVINSDAVRRAVASSNPVPEVKAVSELQNFASKYFKVDPTINGLNDLKIPRSIFPIIEESPKTLKPNNPLKIFERFFGKEEEKDLFGLPKQDLLEMKNPFTANPLMRMFTTEKPTVEISDIINSIPGLPKANVIHKPEDIVKAHQTLLPITPLTNILQQLGAYSHPSESFQVGRDKSISVLGMPIGKRDGLLLSPTSGLSYGKQNMLGPISVNDNYNVKWDFMDKLGTMFKETSDTFGLDAMLAKWMSRNS
uniref:TPT domain-containing protein n=1 Tax=Rhabditophanes sp. KR3021 TaxID=114890 RepID=A0AC35THG0_9BILA